MSGRHNAIFNGELTIMEIILKKCLKSRYLWLALLLVLVSAQCFAVEPLKSKRVIKVAFPQAYPISVTYPDGSRDGVVFDWLMEIAKYTGWEYEFVTDELSPLFDAMYAGEVDIMGGMLKTPSAHILDNCYFPDYIAGHNKSLLFFAKDDKEIQSFDLRTLNDKSIGVFRRAESKIRRLQNILDFYGLRPSAIFINCCSAGVSKKAHLSAARAMQLKKTKVALKHPPQK